MHNWYAIESEAEFRRLEWERAIAAEARAALADGHAGRPRWLRLPHVALSGLKKLSLPRLSMDTPIASRQAAAAGESYSTVQSC